MMEKVSSKKCLMACLYSLSDQSYIGKAARSPQDTPGRVPGLRKGRGVGGPSAGGQGAGKAERLDRLGNPR